MCITTYSQTTNSCLTHAWIPSQLGYRETTQSICHIDDLKRPWAGTLGLILKMLEVFAANDIYIYVYT